MKLLPRLRLPRGVWFEHERARYRVRVYHRQRVVFRQYCSTLSNALRALQRGLQLREELREKGYSEEPVKPRPSAPPRLDLSLLHAEE